MSKKNNNLIFTNNLNIGYHDNVVASNINFTLNEGNYLCVIGSNGAGKSTLIKTLLSFIPSISGELKMNIDKNEIGYLPQQTDIQRDFPASVKEIVLSGRLDGHFKPFFTKEDKAIAKRNMELMKVWDLKDKSYKTLSGGQQQRVLLARALCATKKILLLDEPVTGLDPDMTKLMYELIKKLNNKGMSIIMISHDLDAVTDYATHILRIGNNPFFGTSKEYKEKML